MDRPEPSIRPAPVAHGLRQVASTLDGLFLGRSEVIRLLVVSALAGEHMLIIGPPGTAKSALIRTFAELVDARYFEYLLTRFTEPNELFGPVDIGAFREGRYDRRTEGMLPEAEIVFLDEIFKSNSAILNALLTLLNERRFSMGGRVMRCPLVSAFGASNEVPTDEALMAVFDRFPIRVKTDNLDAYHFDRLIAYGMRLGTRDARDTSALVKADELRQAGREIELTVELSPEFASEYKGLVFQIRAEGIRLSDRRVVHLLKLFSASAMLDGRPTPDASDFFILRHVWNNEDQAALLDAIVSPAVDAFYRDHPERVRRGILDVSLEALAAEVDRIRQVLTGPRKIGDVQLFSQLQALGEVKATLAGHTDARAREVERRVDQVLEAAFRAGRFSELG